MDRGEAESILTGQLSTYRAKSYAELVGIIGRGDCVEITSPSGQQYQVKFNVLWDAKPDGDVRVIASIDDCTFRTWIFPLSGDFIKSPDGTFVDEG